MDSESTIDLFNRMHVSEPNRTNNQLPLKYVGDLCAIFLNLYDFDILHNHTAVYVRSAQLRRCQNHTRHVFGTEKNVLREVVELN